MTHCIDRIDYFTDEDDQKVISDDDYNKYCVYCESRFSGKGANLTNSMKEYLITKNHKKRVHGIRICNACECNLKRQIK